MEIVIPDELYEIIVEIDKRIDIDNDLTQLAEEASELAQASLKYRRALQTALRYEEYKPDSKTVKRCV